MGCCKSKPKVADIDTEQQKIVKPPTQELVACDPIFRIVNSPQHIAKLKETHDKVLEAIHSIPPKCREGLSSYPIIVADSNISGEQAQQIKNKIMARINTDLRLNNQIPLQLERQISNMFDNTWAKSYREHYAEIDLCGDFGGTSLIRVGFIAFSKYKTDLIIALCLYFEKWTEADDVKINTKNAIWHKDNVADFAKYLLYKKVGKDFHEFLEAKKKSIDNRIESKHEEEKKKMEEEIANLKSKLNDNETKTSLYDWLNQLGLKQYYTNFVDDGFDKLEYISDINVSNETALKELGIKKNGHIIRLTKAINALKTKKPEISCEGQPTTEVI